MLTPPAKHESHAESGLVVFVLDISGSMCVSTEIPKGFGLFQVQCCGCCCCCCCYVVIAVVAVVVVVVVLVVVASDLFGSDPI
jgi:hypothetical protein